ncbi:MAG TPA: DUF2721 domain-containing protein [Chryseosolibacter sp.]
MQISINTPALLFPAITLLMLAYTNRFLALATLIRNLHAQYKQNQAQTDKDLIKQQIKNLKRRLVLIQRMQGAGILSFFCCVLCMLFFYLEHEVWAYSIFGLSLGLLMLSLIFSLNEIRISTRALEIELKDMLDD